MCFVPRKNSMKRTNKVFEFEESLGMCMLSKLNLQSLRFSMRPLWNVTPYIPVKVNGL